MFTGIVEVIGEVEDFLKQDTTESGGNGVSMTIANCAEILGDCHLGDSIAVNGVCLTVTQFEKSSFKVGLAPETLSRTNLGNLEKASLVNLERALSASTRFGGHFVQGHIDTTAEIVDIEKEGNSLRFTFSPRDPGTLKYIVEKGFIALDGTSLTVTGVDDEKQTFSVMLIAYTQERVVVARKKVGDSVNVEVDLMGKLVEKQIKAALGGGSLEEGVGQVDVFMLSV